MAYRDGTPKNCQKDGYIVETAWVTHWPRAAPGESTDAEISEALIRVGFGVYKGSVMALWVLQGYDEALGFRVPMPKQLLMVCTLIDHRVPFSQPNKLKTLNP